MTLTVPDASFDSHSLIWAQSRESVQTADMQGGGMTTTSGSWSTANKGYFWPLYLSRPITVKRVYVANGSTAAGAWDVGVYTPGGARLFSSGAVTQVGTSVLQFSDVADVVLTPGFYYCGCSASSTSLTMRRNNAAAAICRQYGWLVATTVHPLPSSVTFSALDAAYQPCFGLDLLGAP